MYNEGLPCVKVRLPLFTFSVTVHFFTVTFSNRPFPSLQNSFTAAVISLYGSNHDALYEISLEIGYTRIIGITTIIVTVIRTLVGVWLVATAAAMDALLLVLARPASELAWFRY